MPRPIIENAYITRRPGRGFRAGFVSTRFDIPLQHSGEADSAYGALLRAVLDMARPDDSRERIVQFLRDEADRLEQQKD